MAGSNFSRSKGGESKKCYRDEWHRDRHSNHVLYTLPPSASRRLINPRFRRSRHLGSRQLRAAEVGARAIQAVHENATRSTRRMEVARGQHAGRSVLAFPTVAGRLLLRMSDPAAFGPIFLLLRPEDVPYYLG